MPTRTPKANILCAGTLMVMGSATFFGCGDGNRASAPDQPPSPQDRSRPPEPLGEATITATVRGVTLAWGGAHRVFTDLSLHLESGTKPDKVWVFTYLLNPSFNAQGSWSWDSIEVDRPFEKGDTVEVSVPSPCPWCVDPAAPTSGYFAKVRVSARSAKDARVETEQRDYSLRGAVPVNVTGTRGNFRELPPHRDWQPEFK